MAIAVLKYNGLSVSPHNVHGTTVASFWV